MSNNWTMNTWSKQNKTLVDNQPKNVVGHNQPTPIFDRFSFFFYTCPYLRQNKTKNGLRCKKTKLMCNFYTFLTVTTFCFPFIFVYFSII